MSLALQTRWENAPFCIDPTSTETPAENSACTHHFRVARYVGIWSL
jgi:hypothetical protein